MNGSNQLVDPGIIPAKEGKVRYDYSFAHPNPSHHKELNISAVTDPKLRWLDHI